MMKAILGTLSGFALIAFTYLCITIAMAVRVNSKHSAELLMTTADTAAKLNKTIDKINGKGGTLQIMNEDLVRVKDTITLSQATLYKEQKSLDMWNANISETLANVNIAVVAATANENAISKSTVETLQATSDSVKTLAPLMVNLNSEIDAAHAATLGVTAMIPDIQATVVNVKGMTADGHETTTMTKDWLHGILHPTWATRVKNAFLDVLQHLPVP
jgi:hypothetical protein